MKLLPLFSLLFATAPVFGITPHVYVTDDLGTTLEVLNVEDDTYQYIFGFVGPRVVKLSSDGTAAYVVENGGNVQVMTTNQHTVQTLSITIPNPTAMAITPNNQFFYVTSTNNNTVTAVRTSDYTIQAVISGFSNPEDIKISPDGLLAYVTNQSAATISVIDIASNTVVDTITLTGDPTGFTLTNDGLFGYVTDPLNDCLYQVDLTTHTFTTLYGFNIPRYIVMSPDGLFAYVTCTGNDSIVKFRISNNSFDTSLSVPSPRSISITPDGAYLYVGSTIGTVFKFQITSGSTFELIAALPGFGNPSNLAVSVNNPPTATINGCTQEVSPGVYQNNLIWDAAKGNPSGYRLYHDSTFNHHVATLPATTLQYSQNNVNPEQSYWYYLIADYANGFSATEGFVEIPPSRMCRNVTE